MNFLAHIHLSHGLEQVMVGNLVADAYKGKKYQELEPELQKGVLLHRKIDDVTDHAIPTLGLKKILYPYFGRYGGVVTDIYFDHFLALYWKKYHPVELNEFVTQVYQTFKKFQGQINQQGRDFLEKMEHFGWLLAYRDLGQLEVIFRQMSRRTGVAVLDGAVKPLEKHYDEVSQHFDELYPLLVKETRLFLDLDKL
jgi:acyl carrier protein phosphodiesterase